MEESLSIIIKKKIKLVGAGRTDTGVHAKTMVAHFDHEDQIDDKDKLIVLLNKFHGNDIHILDLKKSKMMHMQDLVHYQEHTNITFHLLKIPLTMN